MFDLKNTQRSREMSTIEVTDLWKVYEIKQHRKGLVGGLQDLIRPHIIENAVSGINFSIQQGETVGYIGPNGSGKSTTIKMLTGIQDGIKIRLEIGIDHIFVLLEDS